VIFSSHQFPFSGTPCDRETLLFSLQSSSAQLIVIQQNRNVLQDEYFFKIWAASALASPLVTAILKFRGQRVTQVLLRLTAEKITATYVIACTARTLRTERRKKKQESIHGADI
jgi:hypothetical protein